MQKIYALLTISVFLVALPNLLVGEQYENRFQRIYNEKLWGVNKENEGYSGGGSELEKVRPYYQFLIKFIKDHQVKSVVDLGCGDWTFSKWIDWADIDYVGYDVAGSIIEKDIHKYGSDKIKFIHGNFLDEEIPSADLMICKHVLQHMPNRDVFVFLELLPKFKHCLILNAAPKGNENIESLITAEFPFWEDRGIDLRLPPFNVKGKKVLQYTQEFNDSGYDMLIHIDNTEK